jgi:hypothetical protein
LLRNLNRRSNPLLKWTHGYRILKLQPRTKKDYFFCVDWIKIHTDSHRLVDLFG